MTEVYSHSFEVAGRDFLNAGRASTEIKQILKQVGIDGSVIRRVAIAAYEAEMNVVMYACKGRMKCMITPSVVTIVVEDDGPGIPDIERAMQEGYSTATAEMRELGFGAGMGLPNIQRNSDTFRLHSEVGKGTRLEMSFAIS